MCRTEPPGASFLGFEKHTHAAYFSISTDGIARGAPWPSAQQPLRPSGYATPAATVLEKYLAGSIQCAPCVTPSTGAYVRSARLAHGTLTAGASRAERARFRRDVCADAEDVGRPARLLSLLARDCFQGGAQVTVRARHAMPAPQAGARTIRRLFQGVQPVRSVVQYVGQGSQNKGQGTFGLPRASNPVGMHSETPSVGKSPF